MFTVVDPARRHPAALVRRDLGRRRSLADVLTLAHYRELLRLSQRGARHRQHLPDRRSIGGALAVACYTAIALADASLAVRLARLRRLSGDAAARDAGTGGGPGVALGLPVLPPLTPLRETLFSVWLAYTVVWLAYGMRLISGTLLQVGPELEEAARTIGATAAPA